jgi:phage terminase small subunit
MTEKSDFELTDEQKELAAGLTTLQLGTALNYVRGGMSQREAYLAAGGKAKTTRAQDASASEILNNLDVQEFLASIKESAAVSTILRRTEALNILSDIARVDETKYRIQSIKQLGDMEGWNAPAKHEHTGKDGEAIEVKETSGSDLARRIAFLLASGVKDAE